MDTDKLVPVVEGGAPRPQALSMTEFDESRYSRDYEGGTHPLSCFMSIICPCAWLGACFTVRENTEAVILYFGKYAGIKDTSGVHCSNPCGRDVRTISKRKQVLEVPLSKVADANGNPLDVSAVVTFYFENSIRAALAVQNPVNFVRTQAAIVMKQVVSRYPYEERHGQHSEHNLKTESAAVSAEAVQLLQEKVNISGAHILTFAFNDLSYSQEVASGMLKRQQAQALIEARTTIVRGAVTIADSAVKELERRGVKMDDEEKQRVLTNLMSVIVGDSSERE